VLHRADRQEKLRPVLLLTTIAVALGLAACGRATPEQIDQALGITPTPTLTVEQMATATAAPGATAAARTALALAASTPGGAVAQLGDVRRGERQFLTKCGGCHGSANAPGGNLLAPGGPGANVTFESLLPLVREGKGHASPPGPIAASQLDDATIHDLVAYIRSKAGP
jgi:mono/diheme cytochrome c family protein